MCDVYDLKKPEQYAQNNNRDINMTVNVSFTELKTASAVLLQREPHSTCLTGGFVAPDVERSKFSRLD